MWSDYKITLHLLILPTTIRETISTGILSYKTQEDLTELGIYLLTTVESFANIKTWRQSIESYWAMHHKR